MALTTGVQAASVTPASDWYTNVLAPVLTANGWTHLPQISAVNAGTTDVVEPWYSAATGIVGTVYTGCILYLETDNTNARIRIRVSEVYDSAGAGGPPVNRCKWAASGITTSSTATTPGASFAMNDNFGPIFVTPGTAAAVGFVTIPTSVNGFAYWVGGGASRFLAANNSGGYPHFALAGGPIETLLAASDTTSVYLAGSQSTGGGTDPSWTISTSSCGNVRTSREPLTTTNISGAFCFQIARALPDLQSTNTNDPMGAIGTAHKYHTSLVVSPAVMHGMNGAVWGVIRSHRAIVTGMIVTASAANGAAAGDTITAGGVIYIVIGAALIGSSAAVNHVYAIDSSQF